MSLQTVSKGHRLYCAAVLAKHHEAIRELIGTCSGNSRARYWCRVDIDLERSGANMIDHMTTYATDFDSTKSFYSAVLAELGYSVQAEIAFDDDAERNFCLTPSIKTRMGLVEQAHSEKCYPDRS